MMDRNGILYIPMEDPTSESIFPLILGLVVASSVRQIVVLDADCSVKSIRRLQVAPAIARVALGTTLGFAAWIRSQVASRALLTRRIQEVDIDEQRHSALYLNANYWFGLRVGGSVGHIAGVANALHAIGYKIDLASASPQPMIQPAIKQLPIGGLETHGYPQELNLLRFHYRAVRKLKRLPTDRYAFLYQRMSLFNFTGVVLSRLWRLPLMLEYNGSEVWVAQNWGRPLRFSKLAAALEEVCLRHAHRVVVVSRALADEVIGRGVDPARVVCYPNCVDPSHFSPEAVSGSARVALRDRYRVASDEVLIAFVGTFGRWHGAPVLAEAIKLLVDSEADWLNMKRVRFAMIGDGATMHEVRSLIGGPAYSRWVIFTGLVQQSETVKYLAACDILVSPHVANADGSPFFGSPTKLFEYMAMGKGIIASDLDQIGEVLSEGIRIWKEEAESAGSAPAVLARPGNSQDLIAAIKRLVTDPALRNQLGANARTELMRKYTWRHHVNRILESLKPQLPTDALLKTQDSVLIS
jgi:glycosyltransferase involved in cell wall biosynthesis